MRAIIIGAGLGGLTFGAYLARDGWQVDVYDKNPKVGGVCALAEKNGYKWEQGPLILGDLLPGEPVYELLQELGIQLETVRAERGIEMPDYAMWRPDTYAGMYWRRDRLRQLFPEEKEGIHAYYTFYDDMCELRYRGGLASMHPTPLNKLRLALAFLKVKKYAGLNAKELMEKFFHTEKLRTLFTGILADFCASPEEFQGLGIPFLNFETAFDKRIPLTKNGKPYYPGYCYIQDGVQKLPEALAEAITSHGGELHLNTVVEKITVENGAAKGVRLADGAQISADLVVASGGGKDVFYNLVGAEHLDEHYRQVLDTFRPMEAVFMLHLGVDYDPMQFMKAPLCYYYKTYDIYGATKRLRAGEYHGGRDGFLISVDSAHAPAFAPPGHHAVTMYTIAPDTLAHGDWEAEKEQWADALIALAEEHLPGLREHITEKLILAAPDYRRLTHMAKCSFGGVVPIWNQENPAHKTPVQNLWYVGQQSENIGGVGNVTTGARAAYLQMKAEMAGPPGKRGVK